MKCEWSEVSDYYGGPTGLWETTCGECFELYNGTPDDNGMKFCHYCGKELKTVLTPEVEDE